MSGTWQTGNATRPCGFSGSTRCRCTPPERQRYQRRLSGPLLDRIDLRVHVPAVPFERLRDRAVGRDTAALRTEVERAEAAQRARFGDAARRNASLTPAELERIRPIHPSGTAA